jgi:acetyl-CoA acyltransferase
MVLAPALRRRTFVVGGHITKFIGARHPDFVHKRHPDFGKRENPDLEWYISEAVNGALDKTGTPADVVDKAWIGNFAGELFSSQGHLGAAVAGSHPGLLHKPIMRVEGACASGGLAFASALESIQAGSDVNLVVGAEVQTTASARVGATYLARASHYKRQHDLDDFVFPAMFARRIKAWTDAGYITPNDLALLSTKAYSNANKNPLAHMHHVQVRIQNK